MKRILSVVALLAAGALPAAAQGFTVINDRGASVERSRGASAGNAERAIERTGPNGRTAERDISVKRTASGNIKRTVTETGPRGRQNTRSATVSRN